MGTAALATCVLLALAAAFVDTAPRGALRRLDQRVVPMMLAAAATMLVAATGRLVVALAQNDFTYAYVASTSRRGTSVGVRISGLWGGAEGSLLLFTAMLTVAIALVPGPILRRPRALGSLVVATLAAATLFAASPFDRLALPPLSGRGVAPILEHPAMLAHPPLLYVGTVAALTPALCADHRSARRLAVAAFTTITVALLLGASWAYVELGWGGWWAWDPVENVALMPWLLLIATFHAAPSSRSTRFTYALLWPLILAGTAMTRTSLRTSVHAFADAAALRWWLWPISAIAAVAAAFAGVRAFRRPPSKPSRDLRRGARVLLWISVAVIGLGTFRPFVPGEATAGWFYTTTLFPVAFLGALAIGVAPQLHRPPRLALAIQIAIGALVGLGAAWLGDARAWNQLLLAAALGAGVLCLVAGQRDRWPMLLGHLGMLLVVAGALAGTTGTSRTVELAAGATATVAGHTIENIAVDTTGPTVAVPEVRAVVLVDDHERAEPSIAVFAERGLRLPEVATVSTMASDVQIILRSADDNGSITVTVNVQPLIRLVWFGAILLALSGLTLAMTRRYRPSRFERSSSSTVESGAGSSTTSVGAGPPVVGAGGRTGSVVASVTADRSDQAGR